MTRHREFASATQRVAVDGGDDGFGKLSDLVEHALPALSEMLSAVGVEVRELPDVRACDEALIARTRKNDDLDCIITLGSLERVAQRAQQVMRQRVEFVGAVDRQREGTVVGDGIENEISVSHSRMGCGQRESPRFRRIRTYRSRDRRAPVSPSRSRFKSSRLLSMESMSSSKGGSDSL